MTDKNNNRDDSEKLLYCSFCGKSQHEVRKLIAGMSAWTYATTSFVKRFKRAV